MADSKLTKKRAELLAELEHLVGKRVYNGNIQNFGPGGVYEGEGRSFRYPLTMIDSNGGKCRSRSPSIEVSPEMLASGFYAFGANKLYIIKALDDVLRHLEANNLLKLS